MENLQISEGMDIDSVNGSFYSPGDIVMLNSNTAPDGFLACNGATITELEYPALYSILGTYYDSALTVCKLPNLNQSNWFFPCSTVGNEAAYPVAASSHSHTAANNTVTSNNYQTPAHNHNSVNDSTGTNTNHNHSGSSGGVAANSSSNVANRSNGSGQGTNLAIAGHTHSWGYNFAINSVNQNHYHSSSLGIASAASNHSHSSTLGTTTTSSPYILNNVISMRYYIKW
jgi:microcystin-dependent protein